MIVSYEFLILFLLSRFIIDIDTHIGQRIMLSLFLIVLILLYSWLRIVQAIWLESCFTEDLLALIVVYYVYLVSDYKCCMLLITSTLTFFDDALVLALNDLSSLLLLLLWLLMLVLIMFVNDDVVATTLFKISDAWRKTVVQSIVTQVS